jgi:hypothetical protein
MEICFPLPNGKRICIYIPIYVIPIVFPPIPHPDPGPYRGLFQDATILTAVNEVAKHLTDETLRRSLQGSIAEGIKAMQTKAGEGITVSLTKQ